MSKINNTYKLKFEISPQINILLLFNDINNLDVLHTAGFQR